MNWISLTSLDQLERSDADSNSWQSYCSERQKSPWLYPWPGGLRSMTLPAASIKKYLVHTLQNGKSHHDICCCQFAANCVSSVPEMAAKARPGPRPACLARHRQTIEGCLFPKGRDSRKMRWGENRYWCSEKTRHSSRRSQRPKKLLACLKCFQITRDPRLHLPFRASKSNIYANDKSSYFSSLCSAAVSKGLRRSECLESAAEFASVIQSDIINTDRSVCMEINVQSGTWLSGTMLVSKWCDHVPLTGSCVSRVTNILIGT